MAQVGDRPLSPTIEHRSRTTFPMVLFQREHRSRSLRVSLTAPWALSLLFCSLALGLNLYRLGSPSIWFDEAFSVELARQPLPLLWHIIFGLEPNMELYYLLLHGWLSLTASFGLQPVEFVVRLPSAIFASLATVIVFWLGNRYVGRIMGSIAACLYLLNDLQLVYAQQARSYSLQLLLICLAWYALFAATLEETRGTHGTQMTDVARRRQWWACFVVATTLALYTHLFSLLVLLAQLITFVLWLLLPNPFQSRVRQQVRAALISLYCICLFSLPLLFVSLQPPKTAWLPVPQFKDIALLLLTISGDNKIYAVMLVVCCGIAIYGTFWLKACNLFHSRIPARGIPTMDQQANGATPVHGRNTPRGYPGAGRDGRFGTAYIPITLAFLCWLVVPVIVSFAISHGPIHLFSSRYLVIVVPPLLLLVTMGLSLMHWRVLQALLTVGLCLLALQSVPFYYRSAQVEDWNKATFWIEHQYHPGDGLVCYDNAVEQGCQISVEYYLHAYPSAAHFTADAPGIFSWSAFGSAHPDDAVNPAVLAAFGANHTRLFFIIGRVPDAKSALLARQAQHWLDSHYQLYAQLVTRTVTVRLYIT